jgi:hypothetical protein
VGSGQLEAGVLKGHGFSPADQANKNDLGFIDSRKRNVLAPSLRDSGVNLWNLLSPR